MAISLSGCAIFKPEGADAKTPESAAAPAGAASAPAFAAYRLEVDAPDDLKKLLATYLDLGRFQSSTQEGITRAELDRLAAAAPAQARTLVETEGYFNAEATVERSETAEGLPVIKLVLQAGPRTRVDHWDLQIEGELKKGLDSKDPAARETLDRLEDQWPLKLGRPFRQALWSEAKNETAARLRADGYPAAQWKSTEARVDASTQKASITAVLDSGPLFHLGEIRIEGLQRYDEGAIRNLADFGPGTPYTEKRILDFQERLGKLGLFEGVSVEIDPDESKAAATPVTVRVREQTLQQATFGIGYSDNTGGRITLEHRHRRPFGFNAQLHNKLELGRDLRSWDADLTSNPTDGQYRNLIATSVSRLDSAGAITLNSRVRVGRSLDTEHIERLIFVEVLDSKLTNDDVEQDSRAVSQNYNWVWRDVDSILLPTKGLTASIQAAGGYAVNNFASNGPFGRAYGRLTGYWPFGKQWYGLARVETGGVFAKPDVGIPDALLFRAGGDDSVRGYSYRSLGVIKDGEVYGGRFLLTSSVEIARPISPRMPSLWWAVFADGGNASDTWGHVNSVYGYGVGLRWRSPVGPLRIDYAHGQAVDQNRLHLSVGIAF
ncbi:MULTISPECIES: autotransporter assembly complex family protein [unclassified Rhizobacter]|uniref:autotransporter assembly complex protein TamA n=1 Tax=unclassified Rhizobacter TaxID=2640088 RepID=UPI0006F32578|nr:MULTISPECIES: BamA/TamA family outer membrane protein [unclassified Rhizobacter]KQW12012.1 hypothetical protein ASC98_19625 [Rhizobacter sp. Root1238]